MWDYLSIGDGIQSIVIDLPGHGHSDCSPESMTIQSMAQEVCEVMRFLKIPTFDAVGHSMGGYVALELKKIGEGCERIVLLNSNFWSDSPEKRRDRERVAEVVKRNKRLFLYEVIPNLFQRPELHDESIKALIAEANKMKSTCIAACSLAMRDRNDHTELVAALGKNVLIIQGAEDGIIPINLMRQKRKGMQVNYVEIPLSGHMSHIEASDRTSAILRTYLLTHASFMV